VLEDTRRECRRSHQGRTAATNARTVATRDVCEGRAATRNPARVGPLLTVMVKRASTVRAREARPDEAPWEVVLRLG
jgi:hypothetical protein